MVKTIRDKELEAVNIRISAVEGEIKEIQKYAKVAVAIEELEADPRYQLAIEQHVLVEEGDRLCGHLIDAEPLTESDVKAINEGLATIRGFRTIIANTKRLGTQSAENIAACRQRIKEENDYAATVMMCADDLNDLQEKLGE